MAEFSFLSDTDESAVEEIISQATDLSILEQVAAINCSSFSHSVLPTELETRFSKLKSFPSSRTQEAKGGTESESDHEAIFLPSKQNPCGRAKGGVRLSPGEGDPDGKDLLSPSSKQNTGVEDSAMFSPGKENPERSFTGSKRNVILSHPKPKLHLDENSAGSKKKMILSPSKQTTPTGKKNPNSGSLFSPSSNSDFSVDSPSPSPPQKTGCFLCSPKSLSKKKCKKDQSWGKRDELLMSDLGIFSEKSQRKILKEARKEEEKINREAEKIVKWAKQASARMNIEDEHSDDDIMFK